MENYPEHGFPIYSNELRAIGLKVADEDPSVIDTLEKITQHLPGLNAVGRIEVREVQNDDDIQTEIGLQRPSAPEPIIDQAGSGSSH